MPETSTRASLVRRVPRAVGGWIGSAPGTYLWLLVLAATSFVVARMNPARLHWFLAARSTNLDQLRSHPVHALIASAIWTEQASFLSYFVLFTLFHANAERWLGTWRWFTVAATAHVGATFVSEGIVAWGITSGRLHDSLARTVDVGVSYALAGVAAVLTYRFAGRLRWLYGGGVVVFYLVPLITSHTFTDLGHFCAVLIGLCFRPFARGRPTWDPGLLRQWWRARRSGA
ncbi:rhomboid-like protein [Kitasatospora sp. NPDC092286]|uniref:rhomboid-like protein n=1 Tax=Kitasatospora sp. NPDC092286 TaxID=3364087 RepID=UPI00382DFA0F